MCPLTHLPSDGSLYPNFVPHVWYLMRLMPNRIWCLNNCPIQIPSGDEYADDSILATVIPLLKSLGQCATIVSSTEQGDRVPNLTMNTIDRDLETNRLYDDKTKEDVNDEVYWRYRDEYNGYHIMCNKLNSERLENYTKITWKLSRGNSEVALVRNRFHPPKSPSDGVPIYSGCDQTCEDRHASLKLGTWYSLFATNLYGDWILLESVWVEPTDNNHERVYTAPGTDQFEIFLDDNAESHTG